MKSTIICLALILISACNSSGPASSEQNESDAKKDSLAIEQRAIDFYKWYHENYNQLANIQLVDHLPHINPETKELETDSLPYSVNMTMVSIYLDMFRKSGFVTENYIAGELKHYQNCADRLKQNPQTDGPAEGFDEDRIIYSHEDIDELFNAQYPKAKLTHLDQNKAKVRIFFDQESALRISMKKEKGIWKTDLIGLEFK